MDMRRLFLILLCTLFLGGVALADSVSLNSAEVLSTPTSQKLDWQVTLIDAAAQRLSVRYRWLDGNDKVIRMSRSGNQWMYWECVAYPAIPAFDPLTCVDIGDPDGCCTGPGIGIGCYAGRAEETCFTDVFGFSIRTQDVGTSIGVGLRTLIWSKFKADVLSGGNDGTFQ
jgi:hypothetical protein